VRSVNSPDKIAWLSGYAWQRPSPLGYRLRYMVCGLLGHSRIVTEWFGYVFCARCHAQLDDLLVPAPDREEPIIVFDHLRARDCEDCEARRKDLTWRDWWLTWDYKRPEPPAPSWLGRPGTVSGQSDPETSP